MVLILKWVLSPSGQGHRPFAGIKRMLTMAADDGSWLGWRRGEEHTNEEKAATSQCKDLTDEIREWAGREITTQQVGQSGDSREGLQALKAAADEICFRCELERLQRRSKNHQNTANLITFDPFLDSVIYRGHQTS